MFFDAVSHTLRDKWDCEGVPFDYQCITNRHNNA